MKTSMDLAQFQHYCREQHFTAQTQDLLARLGYDNDSYNFGPWVLLIHLLHLKPTLPLRRASFDEPRPWSPGIFPRTLPALVLKP